MNKRILRIIFPLVFLAILAAAIFGVLVMSSSGHMMTGCLGTTPDMGCSGLPLFVHLESHLRTLQNTSLATIGASSLLSMLTVLLFVTVAFWEDRESDTKNVFVSRSRDAFVVPRLIEFMRWLALLEKRDPSLVYAVSV